MNSHRITRLVSAALVVVVLLVGAVLGWPVWLWFLLPTLGAGAVLIDMRRPRAEGGRAGRAAEPEESVSQPPAESPYRETSVVMVPVESTLADCPFLFSATVWWRPVDASAILMHGNPAALAGTSVLQRVQKATAAEHPGRCAYLAHEMEGILGTPEPDDGGLVTAFATDIRLVLRQRDQEHLEELDGLRREIGTWESRRQHERNLREYLGEDVLQSAGSAVVWWMARHDDQIERAVEMIAPLTVLSAAANDEEIPEAYRDLFGAREPNAEEDGREFEHPEPIDGAASPGSSGTSHAGPGYRPPLSDQVSALLDEMGFAEGATDRAVFMHRLARMSDEAGRPEAAENIRRNIRDEGQGGGRTPASPFEDGAEEPASTTGTAYSQPAYSDYEPDRARPPRTGVWQVTSEGVASEADEPTWSGPEGLGRDDTGSDDEGGER